jgi:hypothetical protein
VANSKFFPDPADEKRLKEAAWDAYDVADFAAWGESSLPLLNLKTELHKRLLAGAQNELFNAGLEPALSPKLVAELLVGISNTEKVALARVVRVGLQSLRVDGLTRRRGRPKGWKKAPLRYLTFVEEAERFIEKNGVFSRKAEMKKTYRSRWSVEFQKLLKRESWPPDAIYLLVNSKTPRVYATHMASELFNVSYDRIERACRHAKAAQK